MFPSGGLHLVNDTPSHQKSEPEQQQRQEKKLSPFTKRILIVDDDPDIGSLVKDWSKTAHLVQNRNLACIIIYSIVLYR